MNILPLLDNTKSNCHQKTKRRRSFFSNNTTGKVQIDYDWYSLYVTQNILYINFKILCLLLKKKNIYNTTIKKTDRSCGEIYVMYFMYRIETKYLQQMKFGIKRIYTTSISSSATSVHFLDESKFFFQIKKLNFSNKIKITL